MKRLQYIKPEVEKIPMSVMSPITGSMSTDMQLGKEFDSSDNYGDFMSSFERGKEIEPFDDDDKLQ